MSDIWGAAVKLAKTYELFLYDRVAKRLTGRTCEVEFRQPYLSGTRGIAAREGDTGIIHIKPDLDPEQKLKTFLHECAHIRLDWNMLPTNGDHKQEADTVDRLELPEGKLIPQERQKNADSWAAYWLDFANQATQSKTTISKLTALLNWREVK